MKNKIIFPLFFSFLAISISAGAQTNQKWKEKMDQFKKNNEAVRLKADEQKKQSQGEKMERPVVPVTPQKEQAIVPPSNNSQTNQKQVEVKEVPKALPPKEKIINKAKEENQ